MKKTIAQILTISAAFFAVGIASAAETNKEENSGGGVLICIDWETKDLMRSGAWESCPSKSSPFYINASGVEGKKRIRHSR